jgi:hypothetical protein
VTACDPGTKGCVDIDAADGSADSPVVEATLPEAGDDAMADDKEDKDDKESDGATADEEGEGGMMDGPSDDATGDDASTEDAKTGPPPDASMPDTGPTCTPGVSPAADGCITDASGVFVATVGQGGSDTTGAGSVAKPFATVTHALALLGAKTAIYVCGGAYTDQITVSVPVSIYGGLTCAGGKWAYLASAIPVVTGSTASFAIKIAAATAAVDVEDVEFDGATGATGETSIAAWVNASSNVVLHRVKIVGGMGGVGANGGTPTANYTAAMAPAGTPAAATATAGGTNVCGNGVTSTGGHGVASGSSATGLPSYTSPDPSASNGAAGGPSAPGSSGSDGEGGGTGGVVQKTTGKWSLSESVWIPSVAGAGTIGGPGQGGGGGDGSVAFPLDGGILMCSGGGGGAGGCGGAGGLGGMNGGASFGLVSISSTVTLDQCEVTAGSGGNGGKGGNGEPGQAPGAGGTGPLLPCNGGAGGYGKGGGGGSGGTAGPSVALAYVGTPPVYGADSQIVATGSGAMPGAGGTGGAGDPALAATDPNVAAKGATGDTTVPVAVLLLPTQP